MRALRQEERTELPRVAGQFLVRANLRDAPIEEDHDRVGLADRIVAMGGEQDHLLTGYGGQQVEICRSPTGSRLAVGSSR
jgi:hypothetical protein